MVCPFHKGKPGKRIRYTMQLYPETNSCYCFSAGCPTHGHSLDIIAFVKQLEGLPTDHAAIMRCKEILHSLGRWPMDLYNPFVEGVEDDCIVEPVAANGEAQPQFTASNPPTKTLSAVAGTEEKSEEQTEEETESDSSQPSTNLRSLQRNKYGQLCYIHTTLQIHLLQEPEVKGLHQLRVGLLIQKNPHAYAKESIRQGSIDLYHYEGLQKFVKKVAEQLTLSLSYTTEVFAEAIERLESYRMEKHSNGQGAKGNGQQNTDEEAEFLPLLTEVQNRKVDAILQSQNPLTGINELIGESGIVGEESARLFIFTLLKAHTQPQPLGVLLQGSSGSGKTALFWGILKFFDPKDVLARTRFTEGAFFNFGEHELCHKIIGAEDLDRLGPGALYGLREIASNGFINSSTTQKDRESEENRTVGRMVRGPIGFIGCTTKAELYEDNMGRVFTVAVDEGEEQTKRIIAYQNRLHAGRVDRQKEEEATLLLKHIVQRLKPVEVVNPYAEQLNLPGETHQQRRLNRLFKIYIDQVTRMHQYSLAPSPSERACPATKAGAGGEADAVYSATKEIIQTAADSFFECIVLKCDELNGELRRFYEWLKIYVNEKAKGEGKEPKEYRFTQREVRQGYRRSKAAVSGYFTLLRELEYLQEHGGGNNRKVSYTVDYWDDHAAMRGRLKKFIEDQIEAIEAAHTAQKPQSVQTVHPVG